MLRERTSACLSVQTSCVHAHRAGVSRLQGSAGTGVHIPLTTTDEPRHTDNTQEFGSCGVWFLIHAIEGQQQSFLMGLCNST